MDRQFRGELDAISRDRRSGAAELALRAVTVVRAWSKRHPALQEQPLLAAAQVLLRAQPSMAPLLRLTNEVATAAAARQPARSLAGALRAFEISLRRAPARIGRHVAREFRPGPVIVATYSYSSTVLRALATARRFVSLVLCPESRPGCEGRAMAGALAGAGLDVHFLTDMALAGRLGQADVLLVGADAILDHGFVNKQGTCELARLALQVHTEVWVLADTTKLIPQTLAALLHSRGPGSPAEVWADAPARVSVLNPIFDFVPYTPEVRLLTERGWMTPGQVRRELRKIRISPRLNSLID